MGILDIFAAGELSDDIKLLPIQFQSIYRSPYKALGLDAVSALLLNILKTIFGFHSGF